MIDFYFIVFIFHFSVIPDEIAVLQGCLIEKLQFSLAHPPQSPEAVAPSTGRSRSL